MLLGGPRQSDQRTQSFHFPIVVHQSLDPAAQSSAQAPISLSLRALRSSSARQAQSQIASKLGCTRRRGNHMHDHSRFQRDINDVTGVSLSLSLPLTKVTDAQYRKRFRASYNKHATSGPITAKPYIDEVLDVLWCARHVRSLNCATYSKYLALHRVRSPTQRERSIFFLSNHRRFRSKFTWACSWA